jgi:peptidyl-dipeptidase A
MRHIIYAALCWGIAMQTQATESRGTTPVNRAEAFIARHLKEIAPLEKAVNLAWWDANVSGRDEDFQKKEDAQNRLDQALSDTGRFAELKSVRDSLSPSAPPLVRRQIQVLYLQYLEKQVDPALLRQMTAKGNAVEKAFNVYRAKIDGKELTDSAVRDVLKTSKDSKQRKAVWEAAKGVGAVVAHDLHDLVLLRNQAAKKLGFPNFHALQLHLNEQTESEVMGLFDELDRLTRQPFLDAKAEIDAKLAKQYGIAVADLRPWHYHDPFFQEAPAVVGVDMDAVYTKADILKLSREFYDGLGLPIDDVIARSDLYEKKGKSPHAFCTDIDRRGDVRVLANIVPNEYWMSTMLHELGHSVYSSKNIPESVPYVLRLESHILTTEGVAMLFQKFSKKASWLKSMGVAVADPAAYDRAGATLRRYELLIFSRWCQVMLRFEKALYENPDQDLNTLWWDLVEKYQGLKRPEGRNAPDYASKIHIVSAPVYYHNYMMGELFASQVAHTVAREVLHTTPDQANYVGSHAVGDFFKAKIFRPGRTLSWNELTRFATGRPLQAADFASDFTN